jgi:two-component system LytT family response regulator
MKIRTILVDDEEHAIERLRQLCCAHSEIKIVGEAVTGAEAIEKIRSLTPTLVLLDVHLGAISGLDVLAALDAEDLPFVIFMTAYESHAAAGFEHDAVDYLLKPCTPERFARAINKLLPRIGQAVAPTRDQLITAWRELLVATVPATANRRDGLFVEDGGRYIFVDFATIDYVEAARNFIVMHVGAKSYCHRAAISALELTLDPARYVRVHKSVIVNLDRVESIEHEFNGVYLIRLVGGATCRSGQSYRARIKELLRPSLTRSAPGA